MTLHATLLTASDVCVVCHHPHYVLTGVVVYTSQVKTFAHLDFTWGEDANTLVYADVLKLIQKYNPLP